MKRRTFIQRSVAVMALATGGGAISCLGSNQTKAAPYFIAQFEDKGLAQFSYAILVNQEVVLIDPARDPKLYYDFAEKHKAKIVGLIETHPHADFVSGHLQIHKETRATIYVSSLAVVDYPHQKLANLSEIVLGDKVLLRSIDTPGHSPDSISVVLAVEGRDIAVFSGDGLLLGGVGRPDLREYSGEAVTERTALAKQMYHSIHAVYAQLDDDVLVYPGHGAGSLCGNDLSKATQSTIGHERKHNTAFQQPSETAFTAVLLADQPAIPAYFPYNVALNKQGAAPLPPTWSAIPVIAAHQVAPAEAYIVDSRPAELFRQSHFQGAINIPDKSRTETWLGTVVKPTQPFYLVVASPSAIEPLLLKVAKIGYDLLVQGVIVYENHVAERSDEFDEKAFDQQAADYFVLDVRSEKEAKDAAIFPDALTIPLIDLEQCIQSLPTDKPIAIHCASGYRSAIAASLVKKYHPEATVLDIGEHIDRYAGEVKKQN